MPPTPESSAAAAGSSTCWDRTAPSAKSEASDSTITGRSGSKYARIGAVVKRVFSSLNAHSASLVHLSSFPSPFVSSVSGRATRE